MSYEIFTNYLMGLVCVFMTGVVFISLRNMWKLKTNKMENQER